MLCVICVYFMLLSIDNTSNTTFGTILSCHMNVLGKGSEEKIRQIILILWIRGGAVLECG